MWRLPISIIFLLILARSLQPAQASAPANNGIIENPQSVLSPIWPASISQWAFYIDTLSIANGLDPDFIAAIIHEESNGDPRAVSRVGAVGLMGVMPKGPGLEWRPEPSELTDPLTNLRWGVAIIAEIMRQSGGDVYAALAAYAGGWDQVESRVAREYAASVLNNYGRAIVARNDISPDIASQWTIAIKIRGGDVPTESLLVLGEQPVSGLQTYGEHTVFRDVGASGHAYFVTGYAVPVALVVPMDDVIFGSPHEVEAPLQARLDRQEVKSGQGNPRVLLACLPSLSRLRGHNSTRWFAPSDCPTGHR
ncbi:MAG: transglycosylase SLT domain-containing protein [Ardenticatenaceae bacterium]|nr:transglycosylase SLT domain-containing protein [Ardenticatenaceae bacterium]